jgi:SAM-dependent methyltransferase
MSDRFSSYYEASSDYSEMLKGQRNATFAPYIDLFESSVAVGSLVLDVGCGAGTSTFLLRDAGFEAQGTDLGDALPSTDGFIAADFADPSALADGVFDAVGTMNVLEHVENPRAFLDNLLRVCKPGGYVIILSPNLTSPLIAVRILLDIARRRTPYLGLHRYRDAMRLLSQNLLRSLLSLLGRDAFETRDHTLASGIVGYDVDAIYWTNPAEIRRYLTRRGCQVIRYQDLGRTQIARIIARVAPSFAGQLLLIVRTPDVSTGSQT